MAADVLVVGAGPVGLLVAAELTRYGITVDIIESQTSSDKYSKALSVSAATMKVLGGIGVHLEQHPMAKRVQDINIFFNGKHCAHINKRYLDSAYSFYLSLPQPETEDMLERHLSSLSCVLQKGKQLIALTDHGEFVETTIRNTTNGIDQVQRYDWVIGCDGAQSTVRKLLGIDFNGIDYDFHFLMADVHFLEAAAEQHTSSYHVTDSGFLIFLPMGQGLTRLVIGRPDKIPNDRKLPTDEELQDYLSHYYPARRTITNVEWRSIARIFSRIASTNRIGRTFLAGDSFHLFSPIGGQGMNTGIQDAFNLSWKLAFTQKGLASPSLLHSYSTERYTAVQKIFEANRLHTAMIFRTNIDASAEQLYHPSLSNRKRYRSELAIAFSGLASDHATTTNSRVGTHVPYCSTKLLNQQIRSTYHIPSYMTNIALTFGSLRPSIEEKLKPYHHVLRFVDIANLESLWRERLGVDKDIVCLVRPDGYIGFHGNPDDLEAYMSNLYLQSKSA